MKNWKTTLIGAGFAFATALLSFVQTGTLTMKDAVISAALLAIGAAAKDFDTTGIGDEATKQA